MNASFSALSLPPGDFIQATRVCPANVACVQADFNLEAYSDALCTEWQLPLPAALHRAVKRRRAEYLASRWLAREVFQQFAVSGFLLCNNPDRSPIWPPGIQASLSHTSGTTIIAATTQPLWVGVDVEQMMTADTAEETASMLMTGEEKRRLRALPVAFATGATLLFSLKESLYKALWPPLRLALDFHHAELLDVDLPCGRARLRLQPDLHPLVANSRDLEASFWFRDERVVSLIALSPPR